MKRTEIKQLFANMPADGSVVKVEGTKDVTYYRYRIREYVGGTVDYKWSTSKNDKNFSRNPFKPMYCITTST